ncbi:MAG: leucine-rich repeat domain-containing protein [Flavobacteriia bacterium]|nr:leucine-rich repeat domain-containing protein [Flavobacteriia bacterium]
MKYITKINLCFSLLLLSQNLIGQDYYKLSDAIQANQEYGLTLDLSRPESDTISDEVLKIRRVTRLILKGGKGKPLPKQLAKLEHVFYLELIDYEVTEKELDYLYHFKSLETLYLTNIQFSSAIDWKHTCFAKIKSLRIDGCTVNLVDKAIFELPALCNLYLKNMPLKKLPHGISKASHLYRLSLSNISLTKLNKELTSLHDLHELDLSENQLKQVPKVVHYLHNLEILNLNKNRISNLDKPLACNKNLQQLILNNNNLFDFPPIFVGFPRLLIVDVSNNKIQKLPEELCSLPTNLINLNISGNQLTQLNNCILHNRFHNFQYENNPFSIEEQNRINQNLELVVSYPVEQVEHVNTSDDVYEMEESPITKSNYPKIIDKVEDINSTGSTKNQKNNTPLKLTPEEKYSFIPVKGKNYFMITPKNVPAWSETGFVDLNKKIILPPIYNIMELRSDTVILKMKGQDSKSGVYDLNKRSWVIPLYYSFIERIPNHPDYFLIRKNNIFGIITSNDTILPVIYNSIWALDEDHSLMLCKRNGKAGVYDLRKKTFTIPLEYTNIEKEPERKLLKVQKDSLYNFLTYSNQLVFNEWFTTIENTKDENCLYVQKNGIWKVINMKGEKIISYDFLDLKKYKWAVTTELKCGKLNKGEITLPFDYEIDPKYNYHTIIPAKRNGKYGFLKTDYNMLNEVAPFDFDEFSELVSLYYAVKKNNKYALFFATGKIDSLTDFSYDSLTFFYSRDDNHLFTAKIGNLFYLLNKTGKKVIETGFLDIQWIDQTLGEHPYLTFKLLNSDKKWQLVTSVGKLYPEEFDEILELKENYATFRNGKKSGAYSLIREKIIFEEKFDVLFAQDKKCYGFKGQKLQVYTINFPDLSDASGKKDVSISNWNNYYTSNKNHIPPTVILDTLSNGYFLFKMQKELFQQNVGIMNKKGEIILPPIFSLEFNQQPAFKELIDKGFIPMKYEFTNLLYDLNKDKWLLNVTGFYNEDPTKFKTSKNGKYGITSDKGKILLRPEYYRITPIQFNKGFAIIQNSSSTALYDLKHQKIAFKVNDVKKNVKAKVIVVREDKLFYILDSTMNIVGNTKYDHLYTLDTSDCFLVGKGDKWGVINSQGATVQPFEYTMCKDYWFKDGSGKYGYFLKDGTVSIPFEYDWIRSTGEKGYGIAFSKNKYYMVNRELKRVSQGFDTLISLGVITPDWKHPGFITRNNGKFGYIHSNETILEPIFDTIYMTESNDLILIAQKGNTFQLCYKRKLQTEHTFADLQPVPAGTTDIRFLKYKINGSAYGLMHADGTIISKELFDDIQSVVLHCAIVKNNGKCGVYDFETDTMKIPCEHEEIVFLNENTLYLIDGKKIIKVNISGNTIVTEDTFN